MKWMSVVVEAVVVMTVVLMATNEVIFRNNEGDTDAFKTQKDDEEDDAGSGDGRE